MKGLFRYFELSLAEQRGFIALIIIVLCSLSVPYLYDAIRKEELLEHEVIIFKESDQDDKRHHRLSNGKNRDVYPKEIDMAEFDPNGLSVQQWNTLGLSVKQAQVIKNFEAKGGRFRKKEDLARIYSISDADYRRLSPYIRINSIEGREESRYVQEQNVGFSKNEKSVHLTKEIKESSIDIEKADSAEWVVLKGIGPVLANRIIKYRNALGGFTDIDQIAEVYGLPPETYALIKDKLYLQEGTVKKINVNKANAAELSRHPYISRKQAQWITNYREQHGFYKNLKSLETIELLNQEFLRKIGPYLEF
ncbi:DNA uptake protein ComE [Sphingobacterium nematocida]|uniref:DNA uptake protein ComE n=1 Tax=Sphingobacterium nematocida TaxID=1513896 RepID=A0A1T5FMT3_9SPHI|nr:helix-hairpin-helix domain-containing protein [Sphingobacterium nematocida]SKB97455.1 DNA uptake protein ComE [Sphingobacterium nematocida]